MSKTLQCVSRWGETWCVPIMNVAHISLCTASSVALQDVKGLDLLYCEPPVISIMVKDLSSSSSSSVICQTTGPKPLPKRFLHIVRTRASSFNWQYPLLSVRSSSSFLRLLPRLPVTSICPFKRFISFKKIPTVFFNCRLPSLLVLDLRTFFFSPCDTLWSFLRET